MGKKVVIVESPAKAKTIGHYLGDEFRVVASVGHVRDLPARRLGIDIKKEFAPDYVVVPRKEKVLAEIRKQVQDCEQIYLATDPDREGEAIAWHVVQAVGIPPEKAVRISFDQVTKTAVQDAMAHPRQIDMQLVDAQQARRTLDRLVGYKISPLLGRNLSAGRVQSVALRLVVERECEIESFVPQEYWSLDALFRRREGDCETFTAHLFKVQGENPELSSRQAVDEVLAALEGVVHQVSSVKHGHIKKKPSPPFVTSTLQSEASSRLYFTPRKTMRVAQQLYEGIELDGERIGLITYMRTDSTHVAPEAQTEARQLVEQVWGKNYLPAQPPNYVTKAKSAQEAHEAIRPSSILRTPKAMSKHLDADQKKLYELIWKRFVASQMAPAEYDTTTVDIQSGPNYVFRANARKLVFPGYLAVYQTEEDQEDKEDHLPPLHQGEALDLLELLPEQHFTEPPPRYSEATLIKELEARGIGRPSTYASIVMVIQDREYVNKEKGRLYPTDIGKVVCDALVESFPREMDYGYTAAMENELDQVAEGKQSYIEMLNAFWGPFSETLASVGKGLKEAISSALWEAETGRVYTEQMCPRCGKPLQPKRSAHGLFLGCSGYPECDYMVDMSDPKHPHEVQDEYATGEVCELCGGRMKIIRRGQQEFLGCEHYPKCKNTRPVGGFSPEIRLLAAQTPCPECGHQPLEPKSGRYGEYLFCPSCKKNISPQKLGQGKQAKQEVDLACPHCSVRPLEFHEGRYGPYYHCPACGKNISQKAMPPAGQSEV